MPFAIFVLVASGIAASTVAAAALLARRPWLAALAGIAGATALLLVHGAVYFDYYADDSYITLRYSKHLAEGLGPNWNSEGRVEGYTSFLWMGVLAGTAKLGLDLVDASRAFGFIALIATFLAVFSIWKLWRDDSEPGAWLASPVLPVAAVLGLALTDGVSFWGLSGMETPLFMALLTTSAYLYLRERRGGRFPWSAVALAATAMTRPEGLLAVAVTGGFVVSDAALVDGRRRAVVRGAAWGAVFLLLYGSYFLWRYTYYDYLLPNTYYAKVGLTGAALDRGLQYLATSGLQYQLLAMFGGSAVLAAHPRLSRDALYIIALGSTMLAGVVVEGGGDTHGRFVAPLLPLLFLGGLAGFATLLERAGHRSRQTAAVASAALVLAGLSLLPGSHDPFLEFRGAIGDRGRLGAWFNEHTPPHYTIADFQIGAIAYYASDRDFLDLLGLNDVVIAHTKIPDLGRGVAGHEKYNVDYVLDRARPEIIVLGEVHARPMTAEELQPLIRGSLLTRASAALLTDPRLWERYAVRAVYLDSRWFHFLQRNDTIAELTATGLR